MAEYILVTGSKYNKTVRLVLGILLLLVAVGLVVMSGWRPEFLPGATSSVKNCRSDGAHRFGFEPE